MRFIEGTNQTQLCVCVNLENETEHIIFHEWVMLNFQLKVSKSKWSDLGYACLVRVKIHLFTKYSVTNECLVKGSSTLVGLGSKH
jgi:hypothetical protein